MGSDVRHVRGEAQKELVKKFEVFTSKGRSRWQVWSDWITISAIAVSNATDKSHFDEREQQYMTIVKKYTKQEVDTFADMFSILVMALEDNSEQDFLGELYMCLGLGSDHAGQFFTPYHLCEFMSVVTTSAEEFQQKIGDRGWVAVCDPTCGAGALLVAFANECRKKGINYQTDVLFVAQDIDYIVGMMCYLQMSLLGMPGYVVIGDTHAKINSNAVSAKGANAFKVKGFPNKQKLNNHWQNGRTHAAEYAPDGITTKEQYEKRAVQLLESPCGNGIKGYKTKDGLICRYDSKKNDFAKGSPEKGVRTMFKPDDGEEYYRRRLEAEGIENDE